ncbi:MAG: ATP-dependent Clp protease ATP-binding subunit [Acidobacteriota bacterium]
MNKEELLKCLSSDALAAFDRARKLARANGGALSPLHLLVAALESLQTDEHKSLLETARQSLIARFPLPAQSITVTKETQSLIAESIRLAQQEGCSIATLQHLIRASLDHPLVKESLGDQKSAETVSSVFQQTDFQTVAQSRPTRPLAGALNEFCSDMAEEALSSAVHPFIGREREITAVLETLCRKLKNNPLLIGKPGVGKTALVSAVAVRLCRGEVPNRLRGKRILEVSRLRLLADAKFAGEIEERLKTLLEEVRRAGDVILFFDEIHTLLGAGGSSGVGDVANLLKSSLSRGEITCIGATTLAEYFKYIARDEALARRFSTITIEEPSMEETRRILAEARAAFESYHSVKIDDDVITMIVELTDRYLHSRCFPDKAFDLMDKAAAKATLAGLDHLTRECVTETLSETTGLPLEIMDEDPAQRLERLEEVLNSAVPGQARAARDVARVVRIAKLGLELRPEQPDGVFLFLGPEGVGKHEMATALARFLYGSAQKMIDFDMSQFTEQWSMSRMIGAEPGYVGYGDRSGLLSKAVEDNPHAVLYFRNIDLGNQVVQQFLGEAFERGQFTDAEGRRLSLSNTTVVMSLSRAGENHKPAQVGFSAHEEERRSTGKLGRESRTGWGLADSLVAAIDEVVEFQVLDREATEIILAERLESLKARLESAQPVRVNLSPDLASFFADRLATERKSLAHLERLWQETIVIPFTHLRLHHSAQGVRTEVAISVECGQVKVTAL